MCPISRDSIEFGFSRTEVSRARRDGHVVRPKHDNEEDGARWVCGQQDEGDEVELEDEVECTAPGW